MARVLYSTMINEIKGSVGGLSFHRNSAGTLVRLKPSRVQKNTELQLDAKTIFSQAVNAWATIDSASQGDWNAYGLAHTKTTYWGDIKKLSGFNWFVSCCSLAFLVGDTYPTHEPIVSTPLAVPNFSVNVSTPSTFNLGWSAFAHPNHHLLVFASSPVLSTSVRNRKLLRLIKIIAPGTSNVVSILTEYLAAFGLSGIPSPGAGTYYINVAVASLDKGNYITSVYSITNGIVGL